MSANIAVLLPAAGASTRYQGKGKKQFAEIDGRAVFLRTVELFAGRDDVCQIVLAIPPDDEEIFQIRYEASLAFHGVRWIVGGKDRPETVGRLLAELKPEAELVALHDAVRPCVTKDRVDAVFAAADKHGAAILAHRLVGTIKEVDTRTNIISSTVDRSTLWEAQTPQVFKADLIRKAYENRARVAGPVTDDAQLVEALGTAVHVVESPSSNIKITTGDDLAIAGAILKARPEPKRKGPAGPWAAEQMW